VRKDMKTKRFT